MRAELTRRTLKLAAVNCSAKLHLMEANSLYWRSDVNREVWPCATNCRCGNRLHSKRCSSAQPWACMPFRSSLAESVVRAKASSRCGQIAWFITPLYVLSSTGGRAAEGGNGKPPQGAQVFPACGYGLGHHRGAHPTELCHLGPPPAGLPHCVCLRRLPGAYRVQPRGDPGPQLPLPAGAAPASVGLRQCRGPVLCCAKLRVHCHDQCYCRKLHAIAASPSSLIWTFIRQLDAVRQMLAPV